MPIYFYSLSPHFHIHFTTVWAKEDVLFFASQRQKQQQQLLLQQEHHRILPAFGWHPWFSHQIFEEKEYNGQSSLDAAQKISHYENVLTPPPTSHDFLHALPDPQPLGAFIARTRTYLTRYPLALIGEVGLDRSFRIPEAWLPEQAGGRDESLTPGGREGRRLSPYRVSMHHQKKILLAQLALAGEMHRAVSCHGVQAHGILYETVAQTWKGCERKVVSKRDLKKKKALAERIEGVDEEKEKEEEEEREDSMNATTPTSYPPRLCLHSYSGPAETIAQYVAPSVPCEVFFSFSTTINTWTEEGNGKVEAAVAAVPDERILVESDLHTAGHRVDRHLEEIVRKICQVKGWGLESGVRRLGRNWGRFAFGEG